MDVRILFRGHSYLLRKNGTVLSPTLTADSNFRTALALPYIDAYLPITSPSLSGN